MNMIEQFKSLDFAKPNLFTVDGFEFTCRSIRVTMNKECKAKLTLVETDKFNTLKDIQNFSTKDFVTIKFYNTRGDEISKVILKGIHNIYSHMNLDWGINDKVLEYDVEFDFFGIEVI